MKKSSLQYALDLVALRDMTEVEIRKKLVSKQYPEEEIIKTIEWLKSKNFINDERFTDNYIKAQCAIGRSGLYKIKFKLFSLGISKDLIEKHINNIDHNDEKARAAELAQKWLSKNVNKDNKYEKLGRFLAGRGFEISIIKEIISKILK